MIVTYHQSKDGVGATGGLIEDAVTGKKVLKKESYLENPFLPIFHQ